MAHKSATRRQSLAAPVATALQRLRLADARCAELREAIDVAQTRVLNAPHFVEPGTIASLEERVQRLTASLHEERLAAWSAMRELILEPMKDAQLALIRDEWIDQIGSTMEAGGPGR